jgi:hypothetical protein
VKTDGFPTSLRKTTTASDLRRLFGLGELRDHYPPGTEIPPRPGEVDLWAQLFAGFEPGETIGLAVDASAIAGDISQPSEIRKLAATLAAVLERIVEFDVVDRERIEVFVWTTRDVRKKPALCSKVKGAAPMDPVDDDDDQSDRDLPDEAVEGEDELLADAGLTDEPEQASPRPKRRRRRG